jgi:hypothetical protein
VAIALLLALAWLGSWANATVAQHVDPDRRVNVLELLTVEDIV